MLQQGIATLMKRRSPELKVRLRNYREDPTSGLNHIAQILGAIVSYKYDDDGEHHRKATVTFRIANEAETVTGLRAKETGHAEANRLAARAMLRHLGLAD